MWTATKCHMRMCAPSNYLPRDKLKVQIVETSVFRPVSCGKDPHSCKPTSLLDLRVLRFGRRSTSLKSSLMSFSMRGILETGWTGSVTHTQKKKRNKTKPFVLECEPVKEREVRVHDGCHMPLLSHICDPAIFWHLVNIELHLTVHQLLLMYVITIVNQFTSHAVMFFYILTASLLPLWHHCLTCLYITIFRFMTPTIDLLHFWYCVHLFCTLRFFILLLFYICTLSYFALQLLHNNFPRDE